VKPYQGDQPYFMQLLYSFLGVTVPELTWTAKVCILLALPSKAKEAKPSKATQRYFGKAKQSKAKQSKGSNAHKANKPKQTKQSDKISRETQTRIGVGLGECQFM